MNKLEMMSMSICCPSGCERLNLDGSCHFGAEDDQLEARAAIEVLRAMTPEINAAIREALRKIEDGELSSEDDDAEVIWQHAINACLEVK